MVASRLRGPSPCFECGLLTTNVLFALLSPAHGLANAECGEMMLKVLKMSLVEKTMDMFCPIMGQSPFCLITLARKERNDWLRTLILDRFFCRTMHICWPEIHFKAMTYAGRTVDEKTTTPRPVCMAARTSDLTPDRLFGDMILPERHIGLIEASARLLLSFSCLSPCLRIVDDISASNVIMIRPILGLTRSMYGIWSIEDLANAGGPEMPRDLCQYDQFSKGAKPEDCFD